MVFRYDILPFNYPKKGQELKNIEMSCTFDHCYPMRDIFPNANGYFGPGTQEFCSPGHLGDPSCQWDGRFFDPINSTERWETLAGPWVPFGYFEKVMDFFGDGSFWIIQALDHMPGNLCVCARLENGEWVLLGSDCCHSRYILLAWRQIVSLGESDVSLYDEIDHCWMERMILLNSYFPMEVEDIYTWISLQRKVLLHG